jgi:F-type H+-transporting ATPase subunit epsilon
MAKQIQLDVVTPERQTLSKAVDALVLPGAAGSIGVLPGHMPLVTALVPGLMKYTVSGEVVLYALGGGYAEITPAKVIVLADTAEPAEDIDLTAVQQARDRALAQMKKGLQGADLESAEISLKKAIARMQVADLMRRRKTGH